MIGTAPALGCRDQKQLGPWSAHPENRFFHGWESRGIRRDNCVSPVYDTFGIGGSTRSAGMSNGLVVVGQAIRPVIRTKAMANDCSAVSKAARSGAAIADASIVPSRQAILNSDILLTASCFALLGTAMVGSEPVLDAAMPQVPAGGILLLFASLALMVPLFGPGTWRLYRRVTED